MTRYARYNGNSHRKEHEGTEWSEMNVAKVKKRLTEEAEDLMKTERTENRRIKRQDNKKSKSNQLLF
jgi:hypothetical protein